MNTYSVLVFSGAFAVLACSRKCWHGAGLHHYFCFVRFLFYSLPVISGLLSKQELVYTFFVSMEFRGLTTGV